MIKLSQDLIEQAARVAPDATLATHFLLPEARPAMLALLLFHHEIARARQVVSESMLAAMRLQWWRETVHEIYQANRVRGHPIAEALAQTIRQHELPRAHFDAMIDAYGAEQEPQPFRDWPALLAHCDQSLGQFHRLALLIGGVGALSCPLDEACKQAGIAWRLWELMAHWPKWAQRHQCWLPSEALTSADLEEVCRGALSLAAQSGLRQAKDQINTALNAANRALVRADLNQAFGAIAYVSLARTYANRFTRLTDPYVHPVQISLLRRQMLLIWSVARQRL
ncbi:squalene/phytoene synthase family protein [Candidatus Phycosocius spiralis]|uniref:Phytoene synthase n=1 Tax=Candidatus Phycosocius spiralis TaxID=2815099 RepID=A0ABQ4PTG4_9PROT|nr:squalene/phytoene synthase family protein [Candidatus Phycosocius spiralis]GIU66269.1 phytoene synthase [Candidatus Phycosocius spiralis]